MAELTAKQEKFANSVAYKEFDFIWEAYKAHYSTENMSINTIYQESCRLLANPKVAARIKEIEAVIVSKSQSTLDEILLAMSQRVRLDVRSYFREDGTMLSPKEWSFDQAMCIADYDVKEIWAGSGESRAVIGEIKKVKLVDLKGLWDMFLRKYGAYTADKMNPEDLGYLEDMLSKIKD